MRVINVVGTRPEAIKMAPVHKAMVADPRVEPILVSTGQHREMLDQVFDWFRLQPDVDLRLMKANQPLSDILSLSLSKLDMLLVEHSPDAVLAQGDTTTVLAAGLAAFHRQIPFGHVEAGLRTHDLTAPFPEEGNRALVSRIARWHFAPTARAANALRKENVPGEIHQTGNTVIDALLETADREPPLPEDCALERDRLVLITGHRRENHGKRFDAAFAAIAELARQHPEADFVYPVHLNPRVREATDRWLRDLDNLQLIEPVAYPQMIALMKRAHLILTDSGGVQEEAPSLGTPVLVMRDTTERQEAVEAGVCELVGTDADKILSRGAALIAAEKVSRAEAVNPFGDGKAAQRIVDIITI